jgi:hypothetical protein
MVTITTGILLQEVMVNMVVPTVLATLPLVIFVQQAGTYLLVKMPQVTLVF